MLLEQMVSNIFCCFKFLLWFVFHIVLVQLVVFFVARAWSYLTPTVFLTFMLLLDAKGFNWFFPLVLDLLCSCLVFSVFVS